MKPFYDLLTEEETARLLGRGKPVELQAGEELLREGTRSERLFVLRSGRVRIEREHLGGRIPLATAGAGDVLGELAFLDGEPASATVVVEEPVAAHVLLDSDLAELLAEDPRFAAAVYRALAVSLAARLRQTDRAQQVVPVLGIG